MLRLCRNHSAFNSHNFPRTYTTTYPYVAAPPQPNAPTREAQGLGNYRSRLLSFLWPYFTALFHAVFFLATRDWSLSLPFRLRALHDPLRDYSPPILPLCIQYIQPTYRDCSLHVPRRLWKVAESNRLLILSSSGNYRMRYGVREHSPYSNLAGLPHCFRLFPSVCCFVPCAYPQGFIPSFIASQFDCDNQPPLPSY